MNYKIMMVCAAIGASVRNAHGMQHECAVVPQDHAKVQKHHEKSYKEEWAKFWKIDPALLENKSSEEVTMIIHEKEESACKVQSSLRTLAKLRLENEGFCDPLSQPEQSYEDFWRGRWYRKDSNASNE